MACRAVFTCVSVAHKKWQLGWMVSVERRARALFVCRLKDDPVQWSVLTAAITIAVVRVRISVLFWIARWHTIPIKRHLCVCSFHINCNRFLQSYVPKSNDSYCYWVLIMISRHSAALCVWRRSAWSVLTQHSVLPDYWALNFEFMVCLLSEWRANTCAHVVLCWVVAFQCHSL